MSRLVWQPIIDEIRRNAANGNLLSCCVSAFASLEGVQKLMECYCGQSFYFVTRWRVSELAMGVSDIEIYPLLRKHNIPLYISYRLHSKLYRFQDGSVLCGSGNATGNGLGLARECNIETGCIAEGLDVGDEIEFKKLTNNSLRVTDEIYHRFAKAVEEYEVVNAPTADDLEIYEANFQSKEFLLSDLPATKCPIEFLAILKRITCWSDLDSLAVADCITFQLSPMKEDNIGERLSSQFKESPFVRAIVEEIRVQGTMSFGAVTAFVHDRCRDVPVPFRTDVKERVNTLYNWLCYFFDDLSWDVPGARSQVIRSNLRK